MIKKISYAYDNYNNEQNIKRDLCKFTINAKISRKKFPKTRQTIFVQI